MVPPRPAAMILPGASASRVPQKTWSNSSPEPKPTETHRVTRGVSTVWNRAAGFWGDGTDPGEPGGAIRAAQVRSSRSGSSHCQAMMRSFFLAIDQEA